MHCTHLTLHAPCCDRELAIESMHCLPPPTRRGRRSSSQDTSSLRPKATKDVQRVAGQHFLLAVGTAMQTFTGRGLLHCIHEEDSPWRKATIEALGTMLPALERAPPPA